MQDYHWRSLTYFFPTSDTPSIDTTITRTCQNQGSYFSSNPVKENKYIFIMDWIWGTMSPMQNLFSLPKIDLWTYYGTEYDSNLVSRLLGINYELLAKT